MPRLEVKVGPDRFHMEACRVNDFQAPHEIDTEHFCGRVLVRIKDAPGAKEGEAGREYFRDRSRRFCIQIEGRFKKSWGGDEVVFGSDFDKFVDFPRAPFNAGMRVAKIIDPCTYYEEEPPSKRPYIMSPAVACFNTLCAWPAPHRANDAVVVLRHTSQGSSGSNSGTAPSSPALGSTALPDAEEVDEDVVPQESLSPTVPGEEKKKKKSGWFGFGAAKEQRIRRKYWQFVGFRQDPRVRALLEAHHAQIRTQPPSRPNSPAISEIKRANSVASSSSGPAEIQQGHTASHPTISRLGTFTRKAASKALEKIPGVGEDEPTTPPAGAVRAPDEVEAAELELPPSVAQPQVGDGQGGSSEGEAPEMPPLARITTAVRKEATAAAETDGLRDGDFDVASEHIGRRTSLKKPKSTNQASSDWQSKLDDKLGSWRWSEAQVDMIEDNAFMFTHKSIPVPSRRKHFAKLEHRQSFVFDPDVVYGMSFFTDAFDFNTFALGLGPVSLNLKRFFEEMPIRYTLRAQTRENVEEPVFATISFQLVD
ncbi:DUF1769-domain-containing protein [Ceraceosorus guamensis]|uniref:DUF1769-domain-containing protein n=1 Tax=Ceraceosorus guamensis TaxID=1522189 RepID=A0A316VWG0_9BASI|nr:DUF1769-domain-containing protein [Ceraceosorus guamensis]PWN41779.1 DUF1769-domain-containing protein [Ceraceosorus guamensis]